MKKILVSACLLGTPCRYDGKSKPCGGVLALSKHYELIPVCPEVTGGLPVPRVPVELKNGRVINRNGEDVTDFFLKGVEKEMVKMQDIDLAILQSRSPSCGCKQIYDGTFSKTLIDGKGMFAQALAEAGIPLMDGDDVPEK